MTPEEAAWARYGAWMAGRRATDYAGFFHEQRLEIHTTAHTYVGASDSTTDSAVCTCGLVREIPKSALDRAQAPGKELFQLEGHIRVSDRSLQTIFYVHEAIGDEMAQYRIYCQGCGFLGDAPFEHEREAGDEAAEQLAKLRADHECVPPAGIRAL